MAINYTQFIDALYYPAHNDSYIIFTTNYTEDDRCVIVVDDTHTFTIYPNPADEYTFNLKHIITAKMTANKYVDSVDVSPAGWIFKDDTLESSLLLSITVYGDDTSYEETPVFYFNHQVVQYGGFYDANAYENLLTHSNDGQNYYLTYWEGFPFDFAIQGLGAGRTIVFENKRTGETSEALSADSGSGPYRIIVDKGNTNWHEADYLQLPEMLSQIDYAIFGTKKGSIFLTKKANQCGTYLKWFNADGSYSYWLFNDWFKQEWEAQEIDRVGSNNFTPIYSNNTGTTLITGKQGGSSLNLKTLVNKEEMDVIKSLLSAPRVWMYTSREPFGIGTWLDVKVRSNNITYNSKKFRNQVSVEIELPETQTQTI